MSFLSIFWNGKPSKQQENINMANDILKKLGKEKKEYSADLSLTGGYYTDMVYDDYGLLIVQPDIIRHNQSGLYICFNGEKVLDKKIYNPGIWEEVLKELHDKIPVILEQKRRNEELLEHKRLILVFRLVSISNLMNSPYRMNFSINDKLRIEKYAKYTGYDDDRYIGDLYTVYYNGEEVYRAFYDTFNDHKYYNYKPGLWEKEVEEYLNNLKFEKQLEKERIANDYAREKIKILKNLK